MQLLVEFDFYALSTKLDVKNVMDSDIMKRSVGRPTKEVMDVLFSPNEEEITKASPKKTKLRGSYTNWFLPSLWEPFMLSWNNTIITFTLYYL